MVDVHSHVLPLVDDGSTSLKQSIQMVKTAINQGVKSLVLTPHYRGVFNLCKEEIELAFNNFCVEVEKEGLNINLFLGQEIYVDSQTKQAVLDGKQLSINQTKYILLEFNYIDDCDVAEHVYEYKRLGYYPIVAHIERYKYLTIDDVYEIKSLGGIVQINADSLFGKCLNIKKRKMLQLIKEGLVDVVAGDLHEGREYLMQKAYELVSKKVSKVVAEKLFIENGNKIINGELIER